MTDISDAPELDPEADPPVKPPPVDFIPVPGAENLPDDVRNGDPTVDTVDAVDEAPDTTPTLEV